ncbi:MAG: CBS domain-containing protein [Nitrososphaerota archaeon]|nr:CBS domain-containing protein [Nitrososphaerota archaeon]
MTTDVPQIDASASVLEAVNLMNEKRRSGIIVFEAGKPAGMFTERSLLRRFVPMDKKASAVTLREVMAPLLKIDADASIKDAASMILENSFTRAGVFKGDKLVGWLTLTDIVRAGSKKSIVDSIRRGNTKFADDELVCPACSSAVMKKVVNARGVILRWECPNCGHQE